LVAFNEKGEVKMVNQAFLEQFGLPDITNLDRLEEVSAELPGFFREFTPGRERLKKTLLPDGQHHLIFLASGFVLKGEKITLLSVRDISREMDRNELEAWQKLLRVLRHEILNSISPIKLIVSNLSEMLQPEGKMIPLTQLKENEIEDMKTGLNTIQRRATGLSAFLDAYSNLYRVPDLQVKPELVRDLLDRVVLLFREQFMREKISCSIQCANMELIIAMDERMIEQVLINLVKNSMDAVREKEDQSIQIYAEVRDRLPLIGVKDNGDGISPDQLESIFIPFYSTKEGGTGIGLSFSQHIMRLHHGQLKVNSSPGLGTDFQLVFPLT
ncbi:MAG: ATP-binding protein, partial [Bacteroidales bacterium]|nr:ATP-binding protein [Bacteroidales bacterium]